MGEILTWKCYEQVLHIMRFFGVFQLDRQTTPRWKFMFHQVFMRFVLFLQVLYAGQQIIYMYQARSDTDKVTDTMFLFFTFVVSLYKQFTFWLKAEKIEEILIMVKKPIFNQSVDQHHKLHNKAFWITDIIIKVFMFMPILTCLLWILFPVIKRIKGDPFEVTIWLPFDAYENDAICYSVLFYTYIQTSILGVINPVIDVFVYTSLVQCKTQINIFRYDLENIVEKSKEKALKENMSLSATFNRLFYPLLLHYDEIVRFTNKTMEVFTGAVACQFLVTGWIICTTAYRTFNLKPASVQFVSMVVYMVCILVELFNYCFWGNEVFYESETIMQSARYSNWIDIPVHQRRSFMILLERIRKPITPMAGHIIPLSVSTFITILKTSYTFYTILKKGNT